MKAEVTGDRWLGADKLLHLLCSFVGVTLLAAGARGLGLPSGIALAAGVVITAALGVVKEAWADERWSWRDLVADGVGIGAAVATGARG